MNGQRGVEVQLYSFFNLGTRWGVGGWERDPVPILQEAGWAPGPVWNGVENLAPAAFDPRTFQFVASRYTD
jgi:hypothetical protein